MPNRINPEFWNYETALNALRFPAQLFFHKLSLAVDDYHRCFVGKSPQEPTFLRSTLYPVSDNIRLSEVARWLEDCKLAGIVQVRDSERGWYVEIAERMRYRREDYEEAQPKYGPRIERRPKQTDLPLGPIEVERPSTPRRRADSRKPPAQANRVESDYVSEDATNRAPSRGGESGQPPAAGKFAKWIEDKPGDDLWRSLCETLGRAEMEASGDLWHSRICLRRQCVSFALGDYLAKTPSQRGEIKNVAAWINSEFEKHKRNDRRAG